MSAMMRPATDTVTTRCIPLNLNWVVGSRQLYRFGFHGAVAPCVGRLGFVRLGGLSTKIGHDGISRLLVDSETQRD